MKVGIIGLGFVGLSFATVLNYKGYHVLAVDSNKKKIEKIKKGISPFYEPKLEHLLKKAVRRSLDVSTNIRKLVEKCDLIFITVGTPTSKNGKINLTSINIVAKQIGILLTKTKNNPIIVIKSTVLPGTNEIIKTILEKNSKKKSGNGFGLVSNPEFLREGKAMDDTINPHIVVIGGQERKTLNKINRFYKNLYGKKIPIIVTNPQTAEMIKYANNSFLATKISFINQIANICQSFQNINVDDVAKAIGLDPRIGSLFLKAGPGYGGSCLPKDLQALISFSSENGKNPLFLKSVQKTNSLQVSNLVSIIKEKIIPLKRKKITILGLSFKENTDDIRESVSIKLIKLLMKERPKIVVHDPKAMDNTKKIFGNNISYAKSVMDALRGSHCVILMTPWKQYERLKNDSFKTMKTKIIIDTRRMLSKKKLNADYLAFGLGK